MLTSTQKEIIKELEKASQFADLQVKLMASQRNRKDARGPLPKEWRLFPAMLSVASRTLQLGVCEQQRLFAIIMCEFERLFITDAEETLRMLKKANEKQKYQRNSGGQHNFLIKKNADK